MQRPREAILTMETIMTPFMTAKRATRVSSVVVRTMNTLVVR